MLDFDEVNRILSSLTLLRFFPSEVPARLALASLVTDMASDYDQIRWLVKRTMTLCNEWPGPLVLRQIFCSRFKPRDGFEAGSTLMFPEGPPPEKAIAAPVLAALPPGHVATRDAELDAAVQQLADSKDLSKFSPSDHLEKLRQARLRREHQELMDAAGVKPVTQADIDRAVEEARKKKAEERT